MRRALCRGARPELGRQGDLETLSGDFDDDGFARLLRRCGWGAGGGRELIVELGLDPAREHRERFIDEFVPVVEMLTLD